MKVPPVRGLFDCAEARAAGKARVAAPATRNLRRLTPPWTLGFAIPISFCHRRMRDATRRCAARGCRGVCRTPSALSTSRAPPGPDGPCYTPAHRASRTGRSLMYRLVSLLVVLAVLLLPTGAPPTPAQQKTLVVTGYGGRWSEVMKKALIDPFEKQHGVKIELVTGITTEWVAKLMAGGPGNPGFDPVMGNEPPLPTPRERGCFPPPNIAPPPPPPP